MKIAAGILCWNQTKNEREGLFDDCYKSLKEADPDILVVADNGSTDGTAERIGSLPEGICFPRLAGFPHANTCGYGMNKLAATLLTHEPDLIVLSNDDIVWQADSMQRLRNLWAEIPEDVKIISGLVEPTFRHPKATEAWNYPYGVSECAGERVMMRKSVPGGAWTFRAEDFPLIFPVSTFKGVDDVPACHRLNEKHLGTGAVDLATHAGADRSTWGNGSQQFMVATAEQTWEYFL